MDIRQLVIASKERDRVVKDLCTLFNLKVAFNDPGIINFGLENALLPVGETFLEVISPVEDNTTAERFINRRNGDGGYMVIIQVEDFIKSKNLVESNNIQIVWNSNSPEAKAMHLHPKQMGGAILSLDQMTPTDSWKWAGADWEKFVDISVVNSLVGVKIQSSDPDNMKAKWEKVLGVQAVNNKIQLDSTWIEFIEEVDGRGEGIYSFNISVKDIDGMMTKADKLNLIVNNNIQIGGVNFELSHQF